MSESMKIELHDRFISVTEEVGSATTEKLVRYEQLRELFQESADNDTGLLPGEYGLQRIITRNGRAYYLYLEPARVVEVHHLSSSGYREDDLDPDDYEDDEEYQRALEDYREEHGGDDSRGYKFPSPILCLMVALDTRGGNTRFVESEMYALRGPILTGLERLYHAPFSNLWDNGRICWGDNDIRIPTPKAIQGLTTLFFGANANLDLTENRFVSYSRKYFPGDAFLPVHLHMDMEKMLADPAETPESALQFVKEHLRTTNRTVNSHFERFTHEH